MNIKQAKQQVFNTIKAYTARDAKGFYVLDPEQQRPIILMGPPGVGKTEIVHQVAEELKLGFVSYSITHHTRQSMLGLPKINHRSLDGEEFDVSDYTMSEIVASVYETMERTGIREGILFLDEVNCVSETLVPAMLQFLQYKTFGRHSVPEGWIVVTAGNPPEYNRNAREFDIVTWDRLKRIDIEPDLGAWREYALGRSMHAAVLTYLELRKDHFYKIEETPAGRRFVTARGWVDLSNILRIYDELGMEADYDLVRQYIQHDTIAREFTDYLELYRKYRSEYHIPEILAGSAPAEIAERAKQASFDERLSLLGLMIDNVGTGINAAMRAEDTARELVGVLREVKEATSGGTASAERVCEVLAEKQRAEEEKLDMLRHMGILPADKRTVLQTVIDILRECAEAGCEFAAVKSRYEAMTGEMRELVSQASVRLENLFGFAESVWPEGQELLVLVTELTSSVTYSRFIARYGCAAYHRHSEALRFNERGLEIERRIDDLLDLS